MTKNNFTAILADYRDGKLSSRELNEISENMPQVCDCTPLELIARFILKSAPENLQKSDVDGLLDIIEGRNDSPATYSFTVTFRNTPGKPPHKSVSSILFEQEKTALRHIHSAIPPEQRDGFMKQVSQIRIALSGVCPAIICVTIWGGEIYVNLITQTFI